MQEVHQLLLMLVYQTGGSRGMGDGGVGILKMAMLKIAWRTDSRFLVTWDFRVPIVVVQLSLLSFRQLHGHPI